MNIVKVVEGVSDAGDGALDIVTNGMPVVENVKAHKAALEEENASAFKKYSFLAGHLALGFLERWPHLKPAVMKTKNGCFEVVQGFKEPGLSLEELTKQQKRIEDKKKEQCQLLLNPPKPPKAGAVPTAPVTTEEPAAG